MAALAFKLQGKVPPLGQRPDMIDEVRLRITSFKGLNQSAAKEAQPIIICKGEGEQG